MVERREFRRHKVLGEMEIQSVLGAGAVPERRPTVVDCSLGGARLRVHSPARRLLRAVPPCLHVRDSMTCLLRVQGTEIEVFAEVVRVKRFEDDPDTLDVGVRFFQDSDRSSHTQRPMARLARLLEPNRSEEEAALLAAKVAARPAAPKPAPDGEPELLPPAAAAALLEREAEPRPLSPAAAAALLERAVEPRPLAPAAATALLERAAAQARGPSARVSKTSARVAKASARLAKTSARAPAQPEPAAPSRPPAPVVPSSDSEVVAWAAARLATPAPAGAHVATAADEVCERGSARLVDGLAIVALSDAFTARVREAGLTAHVTPTADCNGLIVAERTPARLVVRELAGGASDATFDYLVIGTRRPLG